MMNARLSKFLCSLLLGSVLFHDALFNVAARVVAYHGWIQVNVDGFGNPRNDISSLEVFGNQLYAGTWSTIGPNFEEGAEIWRASSDHAWQQATLPWTITATNSIIYDMVVFGTYMYIGTGSGHVDPDPGDGEIWRTDGLAWEKVVTRGFGDVNVEAINALCVFSDTLYAAASNPVSGIEIWRSQSGNPDDWGQSNVDGFGSGGTLTDVTMDVFGQHLYVGVSRNGVAELWRTDDGIIWTAVFTDGLGNADNTHVSSMAEFNGYFYIGLRNTNKGGQVWRSSDGTNWEAVLLDGLGNGANQRPYGLIVYKNQLWLIVSNLVTGAEVWSTPDGETWNRIVAEGWGDNNNWFADYFDKGAVIFEDNLYIATMNAQTGGEIWLYLSHNVYLPLTVR